MYSEITIHNPNITFEELSIQVKTIYKHAKYTSRSVPKPFIKAIEEELLYAKTNFEAKYDYFITQNFELDQYLYINNAKFFIGTELTSLLRFSDRMALFICTAGETISIRNRELISTGLMLEAYANDIIGNLIVERIADFVFDIIKKEHNNVTNRYSPGNCGWDKLNQKAFFSLFQNINSGVSINDAQMMTPVKSLNGIIGIGEKVTFRHNTCKYCSSSGCLYRKQK